MQRSSHDYAGLWGSGAIKTYIPSLSFPPARPIAAGCAKNKQNSAKQHRRPAGTILRPVDQIDDGGLMQN